MSTCPSCGEGNPARARFCMMCATALGASVPVGETRKVVTILFADVKGSTAIGERLDPEAVRRVLTRFYAGARETLERYGGTVEKFIGDAVMAVFGVPRVREDDAIRAVRAAWDLLDVMAAINAELSGRYGAELQLRIGVNTGEVVAGDPSTGSSFVAGDAVNVAARLEQTAPPGAVYLGSETYELARDIADVEPVEPLELKGKSERVPAFLLTGFRTELGASAADSAPLVGRMSELEALESRLRAAIGVPALERVRVIGPAGIGKTRLLAEFERRTVGRARAVRCRCSQEGERAGLAPVRDLLTAALGLGTDPPAEEVEREIRSALGVEPRVELVVMSLRGVLGDDAADMKDDTAWAIAEVLRAVAGSDPLLVAIDDVHLAPSVLRSFLDDLRGRCVGAPVLWLETHRLDRDGSPSSESVPAIELSALSDTEARELLVGASPNLDRGLRARILDAAEGNPLFLLETARLVAEGHASDVDVTIPSGIRALTAARLDELPDVERRVLEVAAVLGRSFPTDQLEELSAEAIPEPSVMNELIRKGFLSPTGDRTTFPHGTMRDITYASTTKQRRADLHEDIAALCERDGEPIEILAHHLERAVALRSELGAPDDHDRALADRAAGALEVTGEQALARGDRDTASNVLPRVIRLIESVGAGSVSRTSAGRLAFRLGAWVDVVTMLTPVEDDPAAWNPLGVALAKTGSEGKLERGRSLLERAARGGDVDAAAALAGTWKNVDDERAYELYLSALELDPADPYALGNVLEYEVERTHDLRPIDDRRPAVAAALERRRVQALAGSDRPWSWFDLAKYELLLGRANESIEAYAAAVDTCTAPFMLDTTIRSLERLQAACGAMSAFLWGRELLQLGRRALFGDADVLPSEDRTWILVGGSGAEVADRIRSYREALIIAFERGTGALISGGTTQGVSALAADVSRAIEGIRSVGYLPASLPDGVALDERYDELHRTAGAEFSAHEPLTYWRTLLDEGIAPSDVRVISIGGGRLTAIELRIALALGATVGVVLGSGGAGAELLRDPTWGTSGRLVQIEPTSVALRSFVAPEAD